MEIKENIKISLIKLKKMINNENVLLKNIEKYLIKIDFDEIYFFNNILIIDNYVENLVKYENILIIFEIWNLFCRLNDLKLTSNDLNIKLKYLSNEFEILKNIIKNKEQWLPYFLYYLEISNYNIDETNCFEYIFNNIFESGKLSIELKFIIFQNLKNIIIHVCNKENNLELKNKILNIILNNFLKNIKTLRKDKTLKDSNIYNKLNLIIILLTNKNNIYNLNQEEREKLFFIVIKLIFLNDDYNCLYLYSVLINFVLKGSKFKKNYLLIFDEIFPFLFSSNYPPNIIFEFFCEVIKNHLFISQVILNNDILFDNKYFFNIINDVLIFINQNKSKIIAKEKFWHYILNFFNNILINKVKNYEINNEIYSENKNLLDNLKNKLNIYVNKYKKITINDDLEMIFDLINEHNILDGAQITYLIGSESEFSQKFVKFYFNKISMKNKDLLKSFKEFFYDYHMKGESTLIDRIFLEFSKRYEKENDIKDIFVDYDNIHVLLMSLLMLNTDLHKVNKANKMKLNEFQNIVKASIPNVPEDLLKKYYFKIEKKEIKNVTKISDNHFTFKIFQTRNKDLTILKKNLNFENQIINQLRYDYLKINCFEKIFEFILNLINQKNIKYLKLINKIIINDKLEYNYFIDFIDKKINSLNKDISNNFLISNLFLIMIKMNKKMNSKIYIFEKWFKNLFKNFEILWININNDIIENNKNLIINLKNNYKSNNLKNESFINKFSSFLSSNDDSFENKYFLFDLINKYNKNNSDLNKYDMKFFNKLIKLLRNKEINKLLFEFINNNIDEIINNKYNFILLYIILNESHFLEFDVLNNLFYLILLLEKKLLNEKKYLFCLNYLKIKNLIYNSSKIILEEDLFVIFENVAINNNESVNKEFLNIFIDYIELKRNFEIIELKNLLELFKTYIKKNDENFIIIKQVLNLLLKKISLIENNIEHICLFLHYNDLILKKLEIKIDWINEELLQTTLKQLIFKNEEISFKLNLFKILSNFIFSIHSKEICYSFILFLKEILFKIDLNDYDLNNFNELFEIIIKINKKISLIEDKNYFIIGLEIYNHLIIKYLIIIKDNTSQTIIKNYINFIINFLNKEFKYDKDITNIVENDLKNFMKIMKEIKLNNLEELIILIKNQLEYLELNFEEILN